MRLTTKEIETIIISFREVFTSGKIYLFGSRVDDTKRGGDIDLFILSREANLEKKIDFLGKLQDRIGEQKIDIVISKDKNRLIEEEALKKGIVLSYKNIKIEKYLNECRKHKLRIEKSYMRVKDIFPLSAPRYERLSDDEIGAIDQYLFRFAKLQDTLGTKLFKLVVSEYVEDITHLTFLDILNQLERVDILDVNIWRKLRDIRNNISHQYDDEAEEMSEALNTIFAYKDELLRVFENIENFYKDR